MDLEKDIKIASDFIQSKDVIRTNNHYNLVYNMTNEDIDMYFKFFPIKDGRVLSVLGSGDHILQAAFCGAKSIYAFDYNPLSLYMARLKITSLNALECKEFLNYFYNDYYKGYFSINYYKKVREYLDSDTRTFWDTLYGSFKEYKITHLFMNGDYYKNRSQDGFLNSDNYYITKSNLNNIDIKYICCDVFDILSNIPKNIKFNSVFLSNIFDWMELKDAVRYPLFIKKDLDKHLYKNAMVAVHSSVHGATSDTLSIIFEDSIQYDKNNKVIVYKKG